MSFHLVQSLNVRVVPVRENRLPAWIVGTAGGLLLLWLVATHSPHDPGALIGAGLFGALWMAGLLLSRRPSPYVAHVSAEAEGIRMGRQWVPAVGLKASMELVPYFLEIGHEDVERVTESIDRLGPVFRS